MGMSSQAYRFQKPDAHIRHSAARNHAKSKNRALRCLDIADRMHPISGNHDIYLCNVFAFRCSNDLAII